MINSDEILKRSMNQSYRGDGGGDGRIHLLLLHIKLPSHFLSSLHLPPNLPVGDGDGLGDGLGEVIQPAFFNAS